MKACVTAFFFLLTVIFRDRTEAAVIAPTIQFAYPESQAAFGKAYNDSITNLTVINTVGRPVYFRAGGDYNDAWTRDGSLNSWNAGSLIDPITAKNTLVKLVTTDAKYGRIIDQGNRQWWDMVIWSSSAWNHYLVTGDTNFLYLAYTVTVNSLNKMRDQHFNFTYGLFKGPSFFNDGIAGYPFPYNTNGGSSFVLDHPGTSELMPLSINCLYYNAYKAAALMGTQLGKPRATINDLTRKAKALKNQINRQLWIPSSDRYAYFMHGTAPLTGELADYQEGSGLAFAILFGVADDSQVRAILDNIHFQPKGLPSIWPHFSMYSDQQPGRHNCIIWPQVNGLFAKAAASRGYYAVFCDEFERMTSLFNSTPGDIREIYNSVSGLPDGGWQGGGHWDEAKNQTWSATAYLSLVYNVIFGMTFETNGIIFSPCLKSQWGPVSLANLAYRNMHLSINLKGNGNVISSFKLDGAIQTNHFAASALTGDHAVEIILGDGINVHALPTGFNGKMGK